MYKTVNFIKEFLAFFDLQHKEDGFCIVLSAHSYTVFVAA